MPPVEENPQPAVIVKDLERRFGSFVAVNRISFEVLQGEIFGFLGPNGAGKSTTIRMLCGILAPTGGGGRVAGFDLRTEPERVKGRIGYMSQRFSLYEDLTVEENIDFYSGIYCIAPEKKEQRKQWVLEMAALEHHRHTRTGALSGGWKQRLALGCAILHEPSILFLDEPTSGVDPMSRRRFWDLIHELSGQGTTVLVTTHYMDEAEHCGRIALIYRGELIAMGAPESLKTERMTHDVLEVLCDRPQEAQEALEGGAEIEKVALFGKALHVLVAKNGPGALVVRRWLEDRGHRIARLEKIRLSLEDVFVSLIEARERAEPLRQEAVS